MKKYISLLLATAATIACTKVALEDNSPIESLPQDGNTENVQGEPSGEKIIISLAETKVSLDEYGDYQFDGDEVIYVKARTTGAVAKLQKSADEKNTFTGVFNGLLGETSETFDFYYNCTDEKGNVVKVQNGQPWLAATGVPGNRSEGSEYSYELSNVMLKQLDGYVCLALNSEYPCTVDFHTLTKKALPNDETTISGIQLGSGSKKPYFVNIVSGMEGGFYLTVTNPKGQKMYTSYGSAAPIDANTSVKVKAFTPMRISGSLTGFETTYDLYKTKGASSANSESNDYMAGGKLKISVQGISNSLLSLDSITITSSDGKTLGSSTSKPEWSNKEYTWYFNHASSHTKWGELTVTATAVFNTPAGQVTADVPALSRHITGLPYKANFSSQPSQWSLSSNASWDNSLLKLGGHTGTCTAKLTLHIPGTTAASVLVSNITMRTVSVWPIKAKSALSISIGENNSATLLSGPDVNYGSKESTYDSTNYSGTLSSSSNQVILKQGIGTEGVYCTLGSIKIDYQPL